MATSPRRSERDVLAPELMLKLLAGRRIVEKKTSFDEATSMIVTETVALDFQNIKDILLIRHKVKFGQRKSQKLSVFVANQIIVTFKFEQSTPCLDQFAMRHGLDFIEPRPQPRSYIFEIPYVSLKKITQVQSSLRTDQLVQDLGLNRCLDLGREFSRLENCV